MGTINGRPVATPTETTTTMQNAATGTGNGTRLVLKPGDEILITTVGASTPTGIVVTYEWTNDNWTTTIQAAVEDVLTAVGVATRILTTTVATTKQYLLFRPPPGANGFQARVSAYVSGNVTVVGTVRSRG